MITDFNTFVCTACSGIHREFSHRVKSISLGTFTEQEVVGVRGGGNDANNKIYMARCEDSRALILTQRSEASYSTLLSTQGRSNRKIDFTIFYDC